MQTIFIIYLEVNLGLDKEDKVSRIVGSYFASNAATIAFHKDDHALAAVEEVGNTLNPGTANTLKLETSEVNFRTYNA